VLLLFLYLLLLKISIRFTGSQFLILLMWKSLCCKERLGDGLGQKGLCGLTCPKEGDITISLKVFQLQKKIPTQTG